jgi:hypothetical protein
MTIPNDIHTYYSKEKLKRQWIILKEKKGFAATIKPFFRENKIVCFGLVTK